MVRLPSISFLSRLVMLAVTLWAPLSTLAAADTAYPETVKALQERYVDEVHAHAYYSAYALRAVEDGYPHIAHLFRAISESEAVHARNFRKLLQGLGAQVPVVPNHIKIGTTRENLKRAATVEADEIDREYPAILERIRPEGYRRAIQTITWAWKAEQQHRALIVKIRKAATYFFGLLVHRMEGQESHYYVCQVCGSTLTEIPPDRCPICGSPVDSYKEVPPFPHAPDQKPGVPGE